MILYHNINKIAFNGITTFYSTHNHYSSHALYQHVGNKVDECNEKNI